MKFELFTFLLFFLLSLLFISNPYMLIPENNIYNINTYVFRILNGNKIDKMNEYNIIFANDCKFVWGAFSTKVKLFKKNHYNYIWGPIF